MCSLCVRLVSLVVRLREWAHRSLMEEEERPDSFLERFRGPELRTAPSRTSNTQTDVNGNNTKGIFKYVCLHKHDMLHLKVRGKHLYFILPYNKQRGADRLEQNILLLPLFLQYYVPHSGFWVCFFQSLDVFRKKWNLFVVSPSDDGYYRWLFVIATAVLYNWFLVVAR